MERILAIISFCLLTTFMTGTAQAQYVVEAVSNEEITDSELSGDDWDQDTVELPINDPHEGFNRKMFNFNNGIKKYFMDPLSTVYDFIIPKKIQGGLHNAFSNLRAPVRFCNSLLQQKYNGAGRELGRFVVNSTIGIGGLFDPAYGALHWKPSEEDFGQTLGHYKISEGSYFVWPVFGPATRRDTIGFVGDFAFDPFTWFGILGTFEEKEILTIISATKRINSYSYSVKQKYESMMEGAIDPYVAVRHAYVENRRKNVKK